MTSWLTHAHTRSNTKTCTDKDTTATKESWPLYHQQNYFIGLHNAAHCAEQVMQENTHHLEQFAWSPPHLTVYVNNNFLFKDRSTVVSSLSFTGQLSFFAALFLVIYVRPLPPLSSSQSVPDLCASFSTINRGGTPEISNCIHSFSVPAKEGQRERAREAGRERDVERQHWEATWEKGRGDKGKKKGRGGERKERAISSALQLRHH